MSAPQRQHDGADAPYMRRALALARLGWGQVAPNPLVGAVLARDGTIVGEGHHARFGGPHAEPQALLAAGGLARGATLYVTLEPCAHHGKTPPCVDAVIAAGVSRVVVAARDPNPDARGGVERLRDAGLAVDVGLLEPEARELNAPFFHRFASDRPWVILKLALSLDAAIADPGGVPRWLTGEESRAEVHRMRAGSDAVAVGAGTARADDPALTVRAAAAPRVAPLRIVFDRRAELPLDTRLARTAREVPTVVVAATAEGEHARALRALGVDVLPAPTLGDGLRQLRARGVQSVLVEGGARLAGALITERLVDRLVIFHAPLLLGAGALAAFGAVAPAAAAEVGRLALLDVARHGDDVAITYAAR